jgi:hypothetical protein
MSTYIFGAKTTGRTEVVACGTCSLVHPFVDRFRQIRGLPDTSVVVHEQLTTVVEGDLVTAVDRLSVGARIDKRNLKCNN